MVKLTAHTGMAQRRTRGGIVRKSRSGRQSTKEVSNAPGARLTHTPKEAGGPSRSGGRRVSLKKGGLSWKHWDTQTDCWQEKMQQELILQPALPC